MSFDFAKLQPGDPVAYMDHFGRGWSSNAKVRFATVDRVTATQIVLSGGVRFRLKDGRRVAGSPYSKLMDPGSDDALGAHVGGRVLEEHNRVMRALSELHRVREPNTVKAMAELLDRIAGVVDVSRARLREIGGGR
jgi:hypothetical protein